MSNFEKEAQKRSLIKGLGRALDPMGQLMYHGFGDYRKIYDAISSVDKKMRERALKSNPTMNKGVHEARMAFKRREFPKVMYYSMKVLDSLNGVFEIVDSLNGIASQMGEKYFPETKSNLTREQIEELKKNLGVPVEAKAALEILLYASPVPDPDLITKEALEKEAGPVDWIKENLPSMKGLQYDLISKIIKNKAGKQREAAEAALRIAESAFSDMKRVFSELESNLGNFDEYIDIAHRAKNEMKHHRDELSRIYRGNFANITPKYESPKQEENDLANQMNKQPVAEAPKQNVAPVAAQTPAAPATPPTAPVVQPVPVQPLNSGVTVVPGEEEEAATAVRGPALQAAMEAANKDKAPETMRVPAALQITDLISRAKAAAEKGDMGIAGALLVKASEICDEHNDTSGAISFLNAAKRVLG